MPDEVRLREIQTDFNISSKCFYQWTSWDSFTNPNSPNSNGNDLELLQDHISVNSSICSNPTEVDVRVIKTRYDWMYSKTVLVHKADNGDWNIGVSKKG